HIIVRAHFQATNPVFFGAAGGQDDHGQGGTNLPEVSQHLQPVAAWQQQVQQNQVDAQAHSLFESAGAVGCLRDFITADAQDIDDAATNRRIVFHNHNAGGGHEYSLITFVVRWRKGCAKAASDQCILNSTLVLRKRCNKVVTKSAYD